MQPSPRQILENNKNRVFGYNTSGGTWTQGKIKGTQNISGNPVIVMEDGTMFDSREFLSMVTPLDDVVNNNAGREDDDNFELPESDGLVQDDEPVHKNKRNGGNDEIAMNIQYDKNGFPILPTSNQSQEIEESEVRNTNHQKTQDPILILLDRSKTEDVQLSVMIPIPVITKDLFNTIATSFDDTMSVDKMVDFMISKIGEQTLKEALKSKILEHFNNDGN